MACEPGLGGHIWPFQSYKRLKSNLRTMSLLFLRLVFCQQPYFQCVGKVRICTHKIAFWNLKGKKLMFTKSVWGSSVLLIKDSFVVMTYGIFMFSHFFLSSTVLKGSSVIILIVISWSPFSFCSYDQNNLSRHLGIPASSLKALRIVFYELLISQNLSYHLFPP